jgi:hypothetical protein
MDGSERAYSSRQRREAPSMRPVLRVLLGGLFVIAGPVADEWRNAVGADFAAASLNDAADMRGRQAWPVGWCTR